MADRHEGRTEGLLGVELGRSKVRLVLLDGGGRQLGDAVERPIAKAGGPRDPIEQEFSTRSAVEAGIARLELEDLAGLRVGTTIGFPNCGVGSGPALAEWLESLSEELDEPIVRAGTSGISYAPVSCIEFVRRVFEPIGCELHRVELAPVAAARVLSSVRSGAILLGSGVSWSARLLNNQVLEAFETAEGGFDDELQVMVNGVGEHVDQLEGFQFDDSFGPNRGLSPAALAPAVGVAKGLLEAGGPNLIEGTLVGAALDAVAVAAPADARPGPGWAEPPPVPSPRLPEPDEGWEDEVPAPPPVEAHVDDLGSIQDELRASRPTTDETQRLRRLPRTIERSRELPPPQPRVRADAVDPAAAESEPVGIEAFGPVSGEMDLVDDGFHVSDFLLGALLMLAVVLAIALVAL